MKDRHLQGEFQSGYLISQFHRKDDETLRVFLGFLHSGSAKKVEKAGVKQTGMIPPTKT